MGGPYALAAIQGRLNAVRHAGHSPVLSQEQIDELVTTVLDAFHHRRPLTLPEIRGITGKRFNKGILSDALYRILVRDLRLKFCPAPPMDEWRAEADEDVIREYFAGLC
jgi:hypothetical protein